MAGITKAERERRQVRAEGCGHWTTIGGPWRWYPSLSTYARRIRCEHCPYWYVQDAAGYQEEQAYRAEMAGLESGRAS